MKHPCRIQDDSQFPVEPHEPLTLRSAVDLAGAMTPAQIFGWLLYLASQTQRTTNHLLEELSRMSTNDAALTQAVQDLLTAYTNNSAAIVAEIANIKAATQPETDPAITDAVSKIEGLVSQMNAATTTAQAAIAPPAASSTEPAAATTAITTSATPSAGTSASTGS